MGVIVCPGLPYWLSKGLVNVDTPARIPWCPVMPQHLSEETADCSDDCQYAARYYGTFCTHDACSFDEQHFPYSRRTSVLWHSRISVARMDASFRTPPQHTKKKPKPQTNNTRRATHTRYCPWPRCRPSGRT